MNDSGERELREGFDRLRREDAAGVPSFRATLARAARRRAGRPSARLRLVAGAITVAAVLAALVLGVGLLRAPGSRGVRVELAATRWRGPTDFLLRLPGAELLRTVPSIGAVNTDWRNP